MAGDRKKKKRKRGTEEPSVCEPHSALLRRELYTLDVWLFSGPLTDEFIARNPQVVRTIQIRGDQTLEDLHRAIFDAFDRWDEHMYEFQIGGRGPHDRKARRYGLSEDPLWGTEGSVRIEIGRLGLSEGDTFGYWFDFGDEWWHQINVMKIESVLPRGRYPRVIQRIGDSPPQYLDLEDEGDESADDDGWDDGQDDGACIRDARNLGFDAERPTNLPVDILDVLFGSMTDAERAEMEAQMAVRTSYDASLPFEELARQVPPDRVAQFMDIVGRVTAFCDERLTEEYREYCRKMAAVVCAKELPGPRQKAAGWAAAIVYTMGRVNFLADPSFEPYMPTSEIPKAFGISAATMYNNAYVLEIGLGLMPYDPNWYFPSHPGGNPLQEFASGLLGLPLGSEVEPPDRRPIQDVAQRPPARAPQLRYVPGQKDTDRKDEAADEA